QLLHNGLETSKQLTPTIPDNSAQFDIGDIGVLPNVHPHLTSTIPGDPADKAGLKGGDIVLAINGSPITLSSQLKDTIEKNAQRAITIRVRRDGEERDLSVTPELNGKVGRIGVGIADEMKSIK